MIEREILAEKFTEIIANMPNSVDCIVAEAEYIADHLIGNGVIVLPCKIGDKVWAIRDYKGVKHPQMGFVSEMFFTRDMKLMIVVKMVARGFWGETVFLTREEAEQALRKEDEGK